MSGSTVGGTTVAYAYDASGQRVSYDNGTFTTYYPTKFYNTDGTTPQKHIFANGNLVLTVEGSGSEVGLHYAATDHLTGSNVVTGSEGTLEELLDYYPYGSIRIDDQIVEYSEQRKFAGHEYDADTSLTYMNARYYDSAIGRFISQDFMSWTTPDNYLHDPQQWNSYAYARNNPLVLIDIDGNSSVSATVKELFGFISTLFGSRTTNDPTLQVQQVSSNFSRTDAMSENSNLSRVLSTWDPVTDKRIMELDPQVQRPATSFINITEAALDTRLRVTQGYRTIEEQNRLYEQGRSTPGNIVTNVRGGESYHNYGRAIDVVVMEQGQPNWNKPITHDIADLGIDQGFSWGGSWSGFRDYPHFEMPLGQSIEELRSTNESR
jgi:RHS repeat-associated protein